MECLLDVFWDKKNIEVFKSESALLDRFDIFYLGLSLSIQYDEEYSVRHETSLV